MTKRFEQQRDVKPADVAGVDIGYEKIIRGLRPFMETLAGSRISLAFVDDKKAGTLSFAHETGTVTVNLHFLRKRGLSLDKIDFCLAHETGHLIQLLEDPEGYLRIFDFIERQAKKKGKDEQEADILEQVYHRFYNIFLDINDNNHIQEQLAPFQPRGSKANVPGDIYREDLFPAEGGQDMSDYTQDAYFSQFLNSLIKKIMTNEDSKVSPDVRKALEEKIGVFGEKLTPEEFILRHIQPSQVKAGTMHLLLKQFLLPVFEELIEKDREAGRLTAKEAQGKEGDPRETNKTRRGIAKKVSEDRKNAKKSSKEKDSEFSEELFKKRLNEAGFTAEEIEELNQIRKECSEEVETLARAWHSFMRVVTTIRMVRERRHKTGVNIKVPDLVLQWTKAQTAPEEVLAMERYVSEYIESLRPKKMIVVLVLDQSGSMDDDKRMEVKKIAYTIRSSLKKFKGEVDVQFAGSDDEMVAVETHLIGFGDKDQELPFQETGDKEIDFYQAVLNISDDLGGTCDDTALAKALEKFSQADIAGMRSGEVLGIVLEITDGETATATKSSEVIRDINSRGIFARAIQIPGDILKEYSPREKEERTKEDRFMPELVPPSGIFEIVWGKRGLRLDHISQLRKIILMLLEEAIETSSGEAIETG